jgi:hypothetical protein
MLQVSASGSYRRRVSASNAGTGCPSAGREDVELSAALEDE